MEEISVTINSNESISYVLNWQQVSIRIQILGAMTGDSTYNRL